MKKISVIVPVYNMQRYVCRGMDSLCNQKNFDKLEIIIVDDGSTDDTVNLCESIVRAMAEYRLQEISG